MSALLSADVALAVARERVAAYTAAVEALGADSVPGRFLHDALTCWRNTVTFLEGSLAAGARHPVAVAASVAAKLAIENDRCATYPRFVAFTEVAYLLTGHDPRVIAPPPPGDEETGRA